jgi:histidine triad (HIT) family protein
MPDCLFCRMASGEMEVDKLHEDDLCFAIRDINPRAPVHFMVIPKEHIPSSADLGEGHGALLARLAVVANQVAGREGLADSGYRFAINCGPDAGQAVHHLHMHVLGGRRLGPEA